MENVRPTFLTVLCILTFIGSAWSIYSGISNYTKADIASGLVSEAFEDAQDQLEGEDTPEFIGKIFDSVSESMSPEAIKNMGLATALASILTLIGAILMWGLRKQGFYIYVLGTIGAIIAPIIIYGGFVGMTAAGGAAFIGILFSILYGLNLKHMN